MFEGELHQEISVTSARLLKLLRSVTGDSSAVTAPGGLPAGSVHLIQQKLVLAVTPCSAPMFTREICAIGQSTGSSVLLMRHGLHPETLNLVTFDAVVHRGDGTSLLRDLSLFQSSPFEFGFVSKPLNLFLSLSHNGLTVRQGFVHGAADLEGGLLAAARRIVLALRGHGAR